MSYNRYSRIGQDPLLPAAEVASSGLSTGLWITSFIIVLILGVLGTIGFVGYLYILGNGIFTISGVPPNDDREVTAVGGTGISVVPSIPTHEVTFNNDGVLSNVAGPGISVSNPTGDVTISNTGVLSNIGGTGISVSGATGDVTIDNDGVLTIAVLGSGLSINMPSGAVQLQNTGVTSNIAGAGIAVDMATGDVTISNTGVTSITAGENLLASGSTGDITLDDELVFYTRAVPVNDTNGPQVSYTSTTGLLVTANEGTWYTGENMAFTTVFTPGITPGEDGQGNIGGVGWSTPTTGEYQVHIDCEFEILPSVSITDLFTTRMVGNFGANTLDPNSSGFIPYGCTQNQEISSPNSAIANYKTYSSMTCSIHAGCDGCTVGTSEAFTLHRRVDRVGGGAAITFNSVCRFQFVRSK